eukprot:CAMPEP_0114366864 /NCGR_PEP_ID=MMETSP0101-20121206/29628_1 /TAXON_ID=38822 ORGANISM="Pteridomonas danica, Strain PT" /NCGR_SAMPLE_ID=MMETSP0101 /ASSEMBLY_ACC=CAM_ASM_000211 /LENGTH=103 /DNA_ID=CAMNT_0001516203 /DNA_START=21 /DNA_END=332 /DNA_ORIENTATION=-
MALKQVVSRCITPVMTSTRNIASMTKHTKDPHAFAVISSTLGLVSVVHVCQPKGWFKQFVDDEPVVAFSCFLGLLGFLLPVVVVPMRRNMGLDTSQYDGKEAH